MYKFPDLMVHITEYIRSVSTVGSKRRNHQFENLMLKPVSIVNKTTFLSLRLIVIIDARDECEDLERIKDFIAMLKDPQTLCRVQLRFFIASRGENHIIRGL